MTGLGSLAGNLLTSHLFHLSLMTGVGGHGHAEAGVVHSDKGKSNGILRFSNKINLMITDAIYPFHPPSFLNAALVAVDIVGDRPVEVGLVHHAK